MGKHLRSLKPKSLDYWTHRLETCDPSELDQLLSHVQREHPAEAALLRQKILTFERVVNYYPAELARFIGELNSEEQLALYHTIRQDERGPIEDHLQDGFFKELSESEEFPSKEEKQAIRIKTVLHFRNLLEEGMLRDFSQVA